MKAAIFGGSFDPVHVGHVALATGLADALGLDRVVLMPTGQPPHKVKQTDTADVHRLAMCRLAAREDERLTVSDLEIQKGGASFTVDTLEALCAAEPETQWHLFMGADMFLTLASWKRFEDIAKMAVLCTVPRDGVDADKLAAYAKELEAYGARCVVCDLPPIDVSSTDIRVRAEEGRSLEGLVPPAVAAYIAEKGLYREAVPVSRDEQFRDIIQARLTPERYRHSLAVADEAKRLAPTLGADPDKAYTAGLLHDILKNTNPDLQLQILDDFDILLDDVEASSKKLWHARSGAVFIEKVLGVTDEEILSAVRYHTTAKAAMRPLELTLYLADFTSADRDYDDVDVMRRLVDTDVAKAMRYALAYTIRDLAAKNAPIHPDTVAAYNEWCMNRNEPKRSVNTHG
ncbi:MAG: nicotinate-nucleotide adenylyltransferase [Clostridia bacterium]|nr:nicotinate-nucleotide adenylyltransferase [Clostridia bacterium]